MESNSQLAGSGPQIASEPTPILPPDAQGDPARPAKDKYTVLSVVLAILLLLTFFSPLGSSLFLPIVVVGGFAAILYARRSVAAVPGHQETLPKSVFSSIVRVILIIGTVIGLAILGFIGLLFIAFNSGSGLDMGS